MSVFLPTVHPGSKPFYGPLFQRINMMLAGAPNAYVKMGRNTDISGVRTVNARIDLQRWRTRI